jgi:hypothetical protein
MSPTLSVFLDFNLPNATTWFYFSWLLAVALFFKFSRLLSIRNWDVVTVFLLVPGLLMIQAARAGSGSSPIQQALEAAELAGRGAAMAQGAGCGHAPEAALWFGGYSHLHPALAPQARLWWGYLWLMCGSGYFFLRCLLDLTLVQRPALSPNLNFGGLFWLAGALLACLSTVAFRAPALRPLDAATTLEKASPNPARLAGLSGEQRAPYNAQNSPLVGPESAPFGQLRQQFGAKFWLSRIFAVLGHLVVVVGLILIGRWHFQDVTLGMAAATFYLLVPYTGLYVGQAHHVWPMALVVWALATYKLPILAGAFLGLAAGTMYFPIVLLPIWFSFYWRRGAGRFLAAFLLCAGLCLAIIGLVLWLQNDLDSSIREALGQTAWQPWRIPTTEGFWTGTYAQDAVTQDRATQGATWAYRIPVSIAYAAFVLVTAFWPWPKNLAHVMTLSAAALIGIQFWYADQGGVYVLWYLPLLLLLIFRPNLEERRPAPIQAETDWLARLGRSLGRLVRGRLLRSRETVKAK